MTGSARHIALNAAATYGRSLYALLCGLFTSRWLLMALGETDYGLLGLVGGLVGCVAFLNAVLAASVARFYAFSLGEAERSAQNVENCRKWFSIALVLHATLPPALVAVGYPCGIWAVRNWLAIPPERVAACVQVWRFACAAGLVEMMTVPFTAMFAARQEVREVTFWSLVATTLNLAVVFYMSRHAGDWLARYAFWLFAAGALAPVALTGRALVKYPECRFSVRRLGTRADYRALASYAASIALCMLSQLVTAQGIAVLVNKLLGPARNAAAAIGQNLSAKTSLLSASCRGALQPAITAAVGAGDEPRARALALRGCMFCTLGVAVFAVPLALEAESVLALWLGTPPAGAAALCRVMLAAVFVDQLTMGHVMGLFAFGRIARFQLLESGVWLTAFGVAWAWIAAGGDVVGVGVGFLVMFALDDGVKLLCARRACGLSVRAWARRTALPLVGVALAAAGAAALPRLLLPDALGRLFAVTALAEAVLLPGAWFFVFGEEERRWTKERVRAWRVRLKGGAS